MKGSYHLLPVSDRTGFVYCPPGYGQEDRRYPVVYALGESRESFEKYLGKLETAFKKGAAPFLLAGLDCDWDREMTPWAAPAAFRGQPDFGGGADLLLSVLEKSIKPAMDEAFLTHCEPQHQAVMGYSLGGLAALYSLYRCSCFGGCACLSGSLWYEGWMDYMENHTVSADAAVYLSLGRAEEKSRHPLMGKIGDCTRKAQEILSQQTGREVPLFWHNGGHHTEVEARKLQALLWLSENL